MWGSPVPGPKAVPFYNKRLPGEAVDKAIFTGLEGILDRKLCAGNTALEQ
jgi:hypothetical protein